VPNIKHPTEKISSHTRAHHPPTPHLSLSFSVLRQQIFEIPSTTKSKEKKKKKQQK
jgi:hypothetical protein